MRFEVRAEHQPSHLIEDLNSQWIPVWPRNLHTLSGWIGRNQNTISPETVIHAEGRITNFPHGFGGPRAKLTHNLNPV
jgi:hypothetical protein